jgi:hypothetical protein
MAFWRCNGEPITDPAKVRRLRAQSRTPLAPAVVRAALAPANVPCVGCRGGESWPAGWVEIPEPPKLTLKPKSPRAVVTVAAGPKGKELLAASGAHLRAYADWVGADFVVLDDYAGNPAYPPSCKFGMGRALDFYDRVAFLDADALTRPGCLNVFDLCDEHEIGFCDELPHLDRPGQRGISRFLQFRREQGFKYVARPPWYLNSGVMVWPARYKHLLAPPDFPIPATHHTAEQEIWGSRVLDSGARYRLMDPQANWQDWQHPDFESAPPEAILHWSSHGKGRNSRAETLAKWAARFPWPEFYPGEPPHEWAVNPIHAEWLYRVLKTLRPKRALEIGSHLGYSAQAFLAAAKRGYVGEVHLCDPAITPQLRRTLERFPGVNVTLHEKRSVDLLGADAAWDFVFVDGDHSLPAGQAEAKLLADVPVVMVHDTQDGEAGCLGSNHLKRAFLAAGYHGYENKDPHGRGMFFAARDRGALEAGADQIRRWAGEPTKGE